MGRNCDSRGIRSFPVAVQPFQRNSNCLSCGEQFSPNQLYIRQKDAPKYEPLDRLKPMGSSESPVISLGRPMLFYLSNRLKMEERGFSGDWEGLYSFDLQKRTHLKIAEQDHPEVRRARVHLQRLVFPELLRFSPPAWGRPPRPPVPATTHCLPRN